MATKSKKRPSRSTARADDAVLKMLNKKIAGSSRKHRSEVLGDFIARTYMDRAVRGEKGSIRALIQLQGMVADVDELTPIVLNITGSDADA